MVPRGPFELAGDQVEQAALAATPRPGERQDDRIGPLHGANGLGEGPDERHPVEPVEMGAGDGGVWKKV